jgi:hypothetical protein
LPKPIFCFTRLFEFRRQLKRIHVNFLRLHYPAEHTFQRGLVGIHGSTRQALRVQRR